MEILYGVETRYANVTRSAIRKCRNPDGRLYIPSSDRARADLFGDPAFGTLKHIKITIDGHTGIYTDQQPISIQLTDEQCEVDSSWFDSSIQDPVKKLALIHRNVILRGGSMAHEYPEQLMATMYVRPEDRVLELGANIGRNTLVIATLLNDQSQLVAVECDPDSCATLRQNREENGYSFQIECSAISSERLFLRGWQSYSIENKPPNAKEVDTITYDQLKEKYPIDFNVLVADCEGALFHIFRDYPQILDSLDRVIMENDYTVLAHKHSVDQVLTSKGFQPIYKRAGGWGPCYDRFFEVWERKVESEE